MRKIKGEKLRRPLLPEKKKKEEQKG